MLENTCIDTWIFPVMGISLTLTITIECLTALLWGARKPLSFLLTAAVNLLTNPAVVAAYYLIGSEINGETSSVAVFPDREHGFILDWKGNTAAYMTQREKGERL